MQKHCFTFVCVNNYISELHKEAYVFVNIMSQQDQDPFFLHSFS